MNNTMTRCLLISILMLSACKESNKSTEVNQDQTPVANEVLDELAPDATFNDVITLFETIEQNPEYNSLLKLINQAQMIETVKDLNDVTFFAPTEAAINKLSDEAYADLRLPQNLNKLQEILSYHIVKGERDAGTIVSTIKASSTPYRLQTLQGGYISLNIVDGKVIITDEKGNTSAVTEADMETSDGVIHGIDNLLNPMLK